ncbi:MAG TPA: FAD:protein FMN transferase [Trebonia sp.]|nr:FAD:protein FMN transferase [Trebonia sp.]
MLVQLVVTEPEALREARRLLSGELAELDLACSRFRPDSEVARAARLPGGPDGLVELTVSPVLAEALAVALRAAILTDGDVDPTVGAVLAALGYDRDFGEVPGTGPAVRLRNVIIPGWQSIDLDLATRTLTMPAGVRLDLGATVKSWAADRAADRIARELRCGVLVSVGGDTAVAGEAPPGGWRLRIQDVTGLPGDPALGGGSGGSHGATVVAIRDGGLATSSTMARHWRRGGQVLHHILDPRTALPAPAVWRTVSVAAASCADANTAATAAIIRGIHAPGWLAGLGLPSRLVGIDGSVEVVAGWPAGD